MQKVRATVYDFTTTLKVLSAKRCTKWWQCLLAVCCCCAIWVGIVLALDINHSGGREHSSACGHKRHPYKHKPTHTHTNTLTCGWRWQPHTLVHLQCRHSRCSGTFYAFPTKVNSVGASHKLHFHTNASRWLFAPASQHMENDIEMQHSSALCRRSKYAFAKMPHILYISRYVCVCLLLTLKLFADVFVLFMLVQMMWRHYKCPRWHKLQHATCVVQQFAINTNTCVHVCVGVCASRRSLRQMRLYLSSFIKKSAIYCWTCESFIAWELLILFVA